MKPAPGYTRIKAGKREFMMLPAFWTDGQKWADYRLYRTWRKTSGSDEGTTAFRQLCLGLPEFESLMLDAMFNAHPRWYRLRSFVLILGWPAIFPLASLSFAAFNITLAILRHFK